MQELWKRFSGPAKGGSGSRDEDSDSVTPLWQRIIGYVWTFVWLGVASTWYLYPIYELPGELTLLVPLSLTERVGVQTLGGVVLGDGLLVGYLFGAEI